MFLTITDAAHERIKKAESSNQGNLAIYYESKVGCECGNTGIFTLQLQNTPNPDMDGQIETSLGKLPIQKWSLSYLDQQMTLDYKPAKNTLELKGESGMLNPNVIITDQEGQQLL